MLMCFEQAMLSAKSAPLGLSNQMRGLASARFAPKVRSLRQAAPLTSIAGTLDTNEKVVSVTPHSPSPGGNSVC